MSQPPDNHLKALWQGQETETPTMTVTALRALARNHVDNIRGRIWLGLCVAAIEILMFSAYAWRASNGVVRTGYLIILAGVVWMTWRIVSHWPGRLPQAEASAIALVEFHRAELARQQTNFAAMTVTVAPVFLGVAIATFGLIKARPNMGWANLAPVILLTIAWLVGAFVLQRRQARRLREQIAEMDALRG